MLQISAGKECQTVILTYDVAFGTFDELVSTLTKIYEEFLVDQPGFLGVAIHANDAKSRVSSYSQWASREDFLNVLKTERMQEINKKLGDLSKGFEPVLYEVLEVYPR